MHGRNYRITTDFRIKFKEVILEKYPNVEITEELILKTFEELTKNDSDIATLSKLTRKFLLEYCRKDLSVTAKNNLNNVLGRKAHLFHVVFPSIWPFVTSIGAFLFLSSIVFYLNGVSEISLIWSFVILIASICGWFRSIIDEATFKGHHTIVVRRGLIAGFLLFIASEVMLFFGLFWAFFHCAISPAVEVGMIIPALGITTIPYYGVPFFNTALLVASSLSLTLAHKGIIWGSYKYILDGLLITILFGLIFLILQFNEYKSCMYNISDGAFPSAFYMLTGLHGCHVFIGLVWLIINLVRILLRHFTERHYAGFLFSIWYWHFVDIVWIFVYGAVYIWLSNCVLLYLILNFALVCLILNFVVSDR